MVAIAEPEVLDPVTAPSIDETPTSTIDSFPFQLPQLKQVRRWRWHKEPEDVNSLEHFVWFATRCKLEDGVWCDIQRFQTMMLAPYFAGVRETAIVLPKKNSKTAVMALLCVHHMLFEVEEPDILVVAVTKEQAAKLYDYCSGLINRNPWLRAILKPQTGYKKIIFVDKTRLGSLRVLPGVARTSDGQGPTLAIVDELHRHSSSEVYGLLRDGLDARDGKLMSVSTAGAGEMTPLGELRRRGRLLPLRYYEGRLLVALNEERTFAYLEWALQIDDDHEDFKLVKLVNPLHIHTVESLRERFNSPSMSLWQWRRFRCGLWSVSEGGVIDPAAWARCGRGLGLLEGEHCWLGMDLGWRRDTTALVPFTHIPENRHGEQEIVGNPIIIPAPGKGADTKEETILAGIRKIHARNPIDAIVFDPNAEGHTIAQKINTELGIRVVEHSQDPRPMSDSAMALSEAIRSGAICHPDHTGLTSHVLNAGSASIGVGSDRWRFVKQQESLFIDAAIALAIVRRARVSGLAKKHRQSLKLADYATSEQLKELEAMGIAA